MESSTAKSSMLVLREKIILTISMGWDVSTAHGCRQREHKCQDGQGVLSVLKPGGRRAGEE